MKRYGFVIGADWGRRVARRLRCLERLDVAWEITKVARLAAAAGAPSSFRYVFFLNHSAIVPKAITDRFECVNFHCTDLPFGRGGHPIENLIKLGLTETTMTAHRMTEEVDAGPIYRKLGPVSLAGSRTDILARFVDPVADLIDYIVDHEPEPTPQPNIGIVEFERLPQEELDAIWSARQ